MRKLTPEERAAKKAGNVHVHDENCGHSVAEAPVAEEAPAQEASAPAEEAPAEESAEEAKPKKKKKSEEATVAEEA